MFLSSTCKFFPWMEDVHHGKDVRHQTQPARNPFSEQDLPGKKAHDGFFFFFFHQKQATWWYLFMWLMQLLDCFGFYLLTQVFCRP